MRALGQDDSECWYAVQKLASGASRWAPEDLKSMGLKDIEKESEEFLVTHAISFEGVMPVCVTFLGSNARNRAWHASAASNKSECAPDRAETADLSRVESSPESLVHAAPC